MKSIAGHCLGWLGIWDVVEGLEKEWDWSGCRISIRIRTGGITGCG